MSETSPLQVLPARLAAWEGDEAGAAELRAAVAAAAPIRLRGKPEPGQRVLAKAADVYASPGKGPEKLGPWLAKAGNAGEIPFVGPLLGDPAMGRWPFEDPDHITEPDAQAWLQILAATPAVVTPALRRFVRVMFQVRRRETWMLAARAFARLALIDETLRGQLATLWATCWPEGLGESWPKAHGRGLSDRIDDLGREAAHLARHTLLLGCAFRAFGGDGSVCPTLTAAKLLKMKLPGHDADRSVVIRGLEVMLEGPERGEVVAGLPRVARQLGPDVQTEQALLDVVAALGEGEEDAAAAIVRELVKARWRPARLDALWAWLETAAWLQGRGGEAAGPALEAMRANAGPAARALQMRLSGVGEGATEQLIDKLGVLLDRDRTRLVSPERRAALLAEARVLVESEALAEVPWAPLVRVAARGELPSPPLEGRTGEVGAASLGVLLSQLRMTSQTMMRNAKLSRQAVLQVAGLQEGFVATQVAVHTERLLRELATADGDTDADAEQVRLMWQLLHKDPPSRTFEELSLVLRQDFVFDGGRVAYAGGLLHEVVGAVRHMDELRDQGVGVGAIASAFAALVRKTQRLLADSDEVVESLTALAADLEAAAAGAEAVFDGRWAERLARVVLGRASDGGLVGWAWWLEPPAARGGTLAARRRAVEKVMGRLASALELLGEARPSVSVSHYDEVVEAADALAPALGTLGWPERRILRDLVGALKRRCHDALEEGRRSHAVVESARGLMRREDEEGLAELVGDEERLALLPGQVVREVHGFFLRHLMFGEARQLQASAAAQREELRLPSPVTWMMPLYGAVAGGTFLVLDVGESWLDLVKQGAWGRYAMSVLLALAGSFMLLLGNLRPASSQAGRLKTWARALGPFLTASAVSVATSALAMSSLGRFAEPRSVALLGIWSSLSLFLGVFVGLILQGKRVTKPPG